MRTFTFMVLVSLGVLGCEQSTPPSAPAASAGSETEVQLRVIQLLDAGSEPRQALRYQVPDGQVERLTLDMALAGEAAVGDEAAAAAVAPPVRLVVEVGPTDALPDGSVRYGVAIREVTLLLDDETDPDAFAALEDQMAPLADVRGSVEVNSMGSTRVSEFQVPPMVDERLLTMLGNIRSSLLTVPFPEEPVGPGARWQVTRDVRLGNVTVAQTVTYTLSSFAGMEGELQVSFRQTGSPQPLGEVADGVRGQLDAYESSGVGTVDFDLSRITPYSEADVTTQVRGTLTDAEGHSEPLDVRTSVEVAVAPTAD